MPGFQSLMDDAFRYQPVRPGVRAGMIGAGLTAIGLVAGFSALDGGTPWVLLLPVIAAATLWIMAPTVKWRRRLKNYQAYLRQFRREELREALQSDLDGISRQVIHDVLQRGKRHG